MTLRQTLTLFEAIVAANVYLALAPLGAFAVAVGFLAGVGAGSLTARAAGVSRDDPA